MFSEDLQHQRAIKWRTDGAHPVRTLEDARAFIDAVGFCLIYPTRPAVTAPTFIGAVLGTHADLPIASKAAVDPRTREASELVLRLLDEQHALEVPFGEHGSLLVSAAEFPYFYALLGERNPKSIPSEGLRGEKTLIAHTFRLLQQEPQDEQQMVAKLGKSISESALARALHDLWAHLRIVRVGLSDRSLRSPRWDVLYRTAAPLVNRGAHLSQAEALSALISKYLETVIAAELREIEDFFGPLASRARAADVVKALTAAREFDSIKVGFHSMVRLVSREPEKTVVASELGAVQKRSLGGERRTPPDIGRKMVMRHDRRHPQRPDRRDDRSGRANDRSGNRNNPRRPSSSRERKPTR